MLNGAVSADLESLDCIAGLHALRTKVFLGQILARVGVALESLGRRLSRLLDRNSTGI